MQKKYCAAASDWQHVFEIRKQREFDELCITEILALSARYAEQAVTVVCRWLRPPRE